MKRFEAVAFVAGFFFVLVGALGLCVPAAMATWHHIPELEAYSGNWVGSWMMFTWFTIVCVAGPTAWAAFAWITLRGASDHLSTGKGNTNGN